MIAILDYDMGNVGSIKNMINHISDETVIITRNNSEVHEADKIILPGVGSFDYGMKKLNEYGLTDIIRREALREKKTILGICLGMQLLGRRSEEGAEEGLSLIEFDTVRFDSTKQDINNKEKRLKIPHMGWNYINVEKKDVPIVSGFSEGRHRFYFVHSYHVMCDNKENILMTCDYGYKFAAAVIKDNIIGVQFHPEKSHKFGMQLLKNFVNM